MGEVFKRGFGFRKIRMWPFSGEQWFSGLEGRDKKDDRVAKDKEGNLYSWESYRSLWVKKKK